jgi:apoptosis-inducing factor 2
MSALERIQQMFLLTRLVAYGVRVLFSVLRRAISTKFAALAALTASTPNPPLNPSEVKNVVVVGAAFAGYSAARILAASLPRDGRYRVVVIEPNSHFNFTWVMPRFCVVEGHEHKAFIPYTPGFFSQGPKDMVHWVRDRATSVQKGNVMLRSGQAIPYEYLIIATGSTVANGLPSRPGVESKTEGMELLKAMQARIKAAARIVVAGGGAVGVELATDAKDQYPEKSVTLVHSRPAVMHRFGPGLQNAAMDALQALGVDVILGERVDGESADGNFIMLGSGRRIECDCFVWPLESRRVFRIQDIGWIPYWHECAGQINCTGQKPESGLVADVAPNAITPSGRIRVKPTLEIDDVSLPNVFVCGDVADTKDVNPNSRVAARQAEISADNVVLAVKGKKPSYTYEPAWGDGVIKLTLGLVSAALLLILGLGTDEY